MTRGRIGVQIQTVTQGRRPRPSAWRKPRGALGQRRREGRPGGKGRRRGGRHHPQGRRPDVRRPPTCRASSRAVKPGTKVTSRSGARARRGTSSVTVAEIKEDAAAQPRARRARPKEKAKPNKLGSCCPSSPTSRRRSSRSRAGVLIDDARRHGARQRAAGRHHPRDREQRSTTEAKIARRRSTTSLVKMREGRVGDAADEARRAAVLRDARR